MNMHNKRARTAAKRNWWAGPAAFLATMLALPAIAGIDIPNDPLTTAARVAPNILFILDDSGSMAFENMPDSVPSTSTPNVSSQAYTRNTLSYNPTTTYEPWIGADGNRLSGGTSYSAAYGSFNLVGGTTIDLGNPNSCRTFNRNTNASTDEGSGTSVCGGVQTFYVPKDRTQTAESYLGNGTNYYRYQILTNGRVQRAVYGTVVRSSGTNVSVTSGSESGTLTSNSAVTLVLASVAANLALDIRIDNTTSGNSTRNLDYVIENPSGAQIASGRVSRGNGTTYTVYPTVSGQYRIVLTRVSNNNTAYSVSASRYTTNSCDGGASNGSSGWVGCEFETPTGRSEEDERTNYATWFSYHRTRMKAAKAGASEAFAAMDGQVRVGYRSIHGRDGFDIPVKDGNDGRFVDNDDDPDTAANEATTSRSTWYARLRSAIAYDSTPLPSALDSAGRYFSLSSDTGPYGPQSGSDQYSCRQNFAILTTDGYWNGATVDVGNADGTNGSLIEGPNSQSFTYTAAAPYRDNYSSTLADVAMHYWKRDLRSGEGGLENNVPTTSANPAFWQHMVTFGISIGLNTSRGWSSVDDLPTNPSWPDPQVSNTSTSAAIPARMDDLLHAAVNSRGQFVSASNPQDFTKGLSEALSAIQERTSSYSNVATNSVSLDTDTKVFSASYISGIWTGSVTARAVTGSGVSNTVAWTSTLPAWSARRVFTMGTSGGATFPTSTQATALARSGGPANYEVSGVDNANYIKGEQRLEASQGGTLRNRINVLGDIVNSSPAYVKIGSAETLYVGSNGGMLHAFNAANGQELFAYVPSIINWPDLATLSRGDYAHRYFVDGPIVVSAQSLTTDKNILVGTLGRGGKGLFALDVTSPTTFGASNVLWERAEADGYMGLLLGKPILAKAASGANAVVLGNGINSSSERAALIVLDIDDGSVIRTIDTGAGSAAMPNGLSAPVGVYGLDGKMIQYAYAGDMLGNVWKFDLTNSNPAMWSATRLFTAVDEDGRVQPITGGLATTIHPSTRQRWIFFGTGRYLTTEDASSSNETYQGMYAITEDENPPLTREDLTERGFTTTTALVGGYEVRTFEAQSSLPVTSKGWYIDLPQGERIVQPAQLVSNVLITSSIVPSGSACDADGSGFLNALDAFTGTSTGLSYFDLGGDGSANDVVDGVPIGSVNLGVGMPTLANLLRGLTIVGGTSDGLGGVLGPGPRPDRVSWREVRGD